MKRQGDTGADEKAPKAPTDDERLGITAAASLGIVKRYRCGCALVRDGRGGARTFVQGCLTCPGGDEHGRPADVTEAETGMLF